MAKHIKHTGQAFRLAWVFVFVVIVGAHSAPALAGNVDARWVAPVSGDWTDPARWTSNPFYPNNGAPAEAEYTALIDVPGPDYTVTLASPVEVASTLLASPAATLQQSGGTFTVGSLSVGPAGVGHYRITGGTVSVNGLSVGSAPGFTTQTSDGLFEQSGGRVDVTGARIGHSAGAPSTGTLIVSGAQSRYAAVTPTVGQSVHSFGDGAHGTGVARFLNFASVTLGQVNVGVGGGAGTVLIQTGARVAIDDLTLSRSADGGHGTVILGGDGPSRLTLGPGDVRIGAFEGGSGNLIVNGGTLTLQPASPVSFFIVSRTGTVTVNGGTVDLQRVPRVNGGQFIINGGTVTAPGFRVTPTGFTPPSGTLALHGGRLTAGAVDLAGGGYVQSGGTASVDLMEMNSTGEYVLIRPTAHLAGGTFGATALNVNSGTFTYAGGAFDVGYLSVTGGRLITTPGRDKTLRVGTLTMSGVGARLDLGDNFMLLDSGATPPVAGIRALIRSGYNGGAWDGPGIMSSVAQTSTRHGIGYVQPSPLFTPLLVAYTRYGDADVNGTVDLADFNALAANFGTGDAHWFEGDFNYDGLVNLADFNRLAANFGLSAGADGVVDPTDWANLAAVIPEPGTLGMATLLLCGPAVRWRKLK